MYLKRWDFDDFEQQTFKWLRFFVFKGPLKETIFFAECSGDSAVSDDLASLKKQVKEQGDEILVLKSSLADALRRLHVLEERKPASGKYLYYISYCTKL